jgi:hypothetical protein
MYKIIRNSSLELKTPFLFEKRSETYIWYDEVSIGKENDVLSQEFGDAGGFAGCNVRTVRSF